MARNAILLSAAILLFSVSLSSAAPLGNDILLERYFRQLRQANTDPVPLVDVQKEQDEEVDSGVNETFWADSEYMDEDNETPSISLSYVDLAGLEPSVSGDAAKIFGKKVYSGDASQKSVRVGKVFAEERGASDDASIGAENKIPLQWAGVQGLFKQLRSS